MVFVNNRFLVPAKNNKEVENDNCFVLKDNGSIVDQKGNILGNIHTGDIFNADGSFTILNGITKYPDGRLKDKDGNIFNTDGSITQPDGSVTLPDGNTYYKDGKMKDSYGNIVYPNEIIELTDGTVKDTAGILHHLDGSITTIEGIRYYLDGRVALFDGTEIVKQNIFANTTEKDTEGNFVFEPKTNKYKFVSKDRVGNSVELVDQWILKTDQNGKKKWYIVNHAGNMSTGWVKKDGEYYYMSKEIANMGEMVVGRQNINGKIYEFDNDGRLVKGKAPFDELDVIGATNHKLGVDGKWILDNGVKKFMTWSMTNDGTILEASPSGWYMIDGSYYFFDTLGKPLTGLIISDGKYYYMQSDGKMKEGGDVIIGGIKYIFDKATGACRTYISV